MTWTFLAVQFIEPRDGSRGREHIRYQGCEPLLGRSVEGHGRPKRIVPVEDDEVSRVSGLGFREHARHSFSLTGMHQ